MAIPDIANIGSRFLIVNRVFVLVRLGPPGFARGGLFHVSRSDMVVGTVDRDPCSAEAMRPSFRGLRRHTTPGVVHCEFPRGVRFLIKPFLSHRRRYVRLQFFPCGLKCGARSFKCGCCSGRHLGAQIAAWIEATGPLPLVDVQRNALAFLDLADTNLAIVDLPGFEAAFDITGAAGKWRHLAI